MTAGAAIQRRDGQMIRGRQDAVHEVIHRVDVPPGFLGGIGGRLDEVEVNPIRPEILPADQHDDFRWPLPGIQHRLLEALAVFGAHGAVIKSKK